MFEILRKELRSHRWFPSCSIHLDLTASLRVAYDAIRILQKSYVSAGLMARSRALQSLAFLLCWVGARAQTTKIMTKLAPLKGSIQVALNSIAFYQAAAILI